MVLFVSDCLFDLASNFIKEACKECSKSNIKDIKNIFDLIAQVYILENLNKSENKTFKESLSFNEEDFTTCAELSKSKIEEKNAFKKIRKDLVCNSFKRKSFFEQRSLAKSVELNSLLKCKNNQLLSELLQHTKNNDLLKLDIKNKDTNINRMKGLLKEFADRCNLLTEDNNKYAELIKKLKDDSLIHKNNLDQKVDNIEKKIANMNMLTGMNAVNLKNKEPDQLHVKSAGTLYFYFAVFFFGGFVSAFVITVLFFKLEKRK